jgi:SSS family solute:Na+ symporter
MLKNGFSDFLIGLVVLLVLSASISTLSSLVMTSSSTLTLDFLKGHIVKDMSEKKQLLSMRFLVVVFIVISAAIALVQYNTNGSIVFIAQLMGISWGVLAGAFLAPYLFSLYWKRVTKTAVWVNFGFATVFMILNVALNLFFNDFFVSSYPKILQSPINAGAFTKLAGFVIVAVVSALTKAPDRESVEHCFSCYDEFVRVRAASHLGNNGVKVEE